MKPIYVPSGAAGEYGDYALNISLTCSHRCYYCYCPKCLHKPVEEFFDYKGQRPGIIEATKLQLEKEQITGKLIHLCFIGDPYPKGYDSSATREIIKLLKESGNHIQILTKNGRDCIRDFDLLDENDWFGVTITCGYIMSRTAEPNTDSPPVRLDALYDAWNAGINTWVSCEPVLEPDYIYHLIKAGDYINRFKIGKLNYHPSNINWAEFGKTAKELCIKYGREYYIKDSLRAEMERET